MPAHDEFIGRIRARLLAEPPLPDADEDLIPDWMPEVAHGVPPVAAAVMIPIVRRQDTLSVLFTERATNLRAHSGQIAFPGGKIDPEDDGPADAAKREAAEEVAMLPDEVNILGFMPHYFTGTNYLITPVVAVVEPSAPFLPNPREVQDIFEVPLDLLLEGGSYGTFHVSRRGKAHRTWQIEHEGRVIWGITGNLTRRFYEMALREDAA